LYVQNDLPSIAYYNLSGSYDFEVGGLDLEMFMNVNNLFDKDPPLVPDIREPGLIYPTVQGVYDVIGRYYTAGVRFKF
jgi:outer membrane receptor protein involved in Fe transport